MLKQLKIYYLFVSFPFLLLMCGATAFWRPIVATLDRNPHPQINYTIFVIILIGGVLIIYNSTLLMREAKVLREFSLAVHAKSDSTTLKQMADGYDCEIACLMQMMANSTDRSISHQEQAALEHEVTNVHGRLTKRNSLPSYLTGLLVGMGLLGTFIGLLATLGDIGALIGSFSDLDMSAADPIVVFGNMIDKMKAPMASMAIAFSASMFGLLGSIILGLMMVGIRRFQGDIDAVLSSEIARHVELALSFESISFRGSDAAIGCYEHPTELTSKVLLRIEERLAEAARIRQRALSAEIDDFKIQRADMLQALTEQTEANNRFSAQLLQLGNQMGTIFSAMEQKNSDISTQLSELTVGLAGDAKQTHKVLASQLEEQRKLIETLGAYNIEERWNESSRVQQRMLSAVVEDMKNQREEVLQTMKEQNENGKNLQIELQQMRGQLGTISSNLESGNEGISGQLSEMTVLIGADAKESQRLISIANNNVRSELQQLGSRLGELIGQLEEPLEKGLQAICGSVSTLQTELTAQNEKSQQQLEKLSRLTEEGALNAHQVMTEIRSRLEQEIELLGKHLGTIQLAMEQGNGEVAHKLSELIQNRASDAKASHDLLSKLLSVQVTAPESVQEQEA